MVGTCGSEGRRLRDLILDVSDNTCAHRSVIKPFMRALLFATSGSWLQLKDLHLDLGGLHSADNDLSDIGNLGPWRGRQRAAPCNGSLRALRRLYLGIRGSTLHGMATESLVWLRLSLLEELYLDIRNCDLRNEDWDALRGLCTLRCIHLWLGEGASRSDVMRVCGMLYRHDSKIRALHLHVSGDLPSSFDILQSTEPRLRIHSAPLSPTAEDEHHDLHSSSE